MPEKTSNRLIYKQQEVRDKILSGIDTIADPVKQTLSPKGRNVLYVSPVGKPTVTNDGITIAKEIAVEDQIQNSIIELIRGASLKTNAEAGDGTTTTILLTQVLAKEGLKLLDEGHSWVEIRNSFINMGKTLTNRLEKKVAEAKDPKDLLNIARISANNDDEIAKHTVKVVSTAKDTGMVFIEPSKSGNTEVLEDPGFLIKCGILYQELLTDSKPIVRYEKPAVLVTDKKIYYREEAESIIRMAVKSGYDALVIIAKDIIGDAVNTFIYNHQKGNLNILLVKDSLTTDKDNTSLHDLALYLGTKVFTDKTGDLVNKLRKEDLMVVNRVYADPQKTLITPLVSPSKELKEKIAYLEKEKEKNPDDERLKERIASLTTGVVTVKVGGNTDVEVNEKIFRYEDAINASRATMRAGYLPGGGTSILREFHEEDYPTFMLPVARRYTESILRQIAENCGKHPDTVVETVRKGKGYNALKDRYEDLLKAGVVDPFLVLKHSIQNSVSAANLITSLGAFIIYDYDRGEETK